MARVFMVPTYVIVDEESDSAELPVTSETAKDFLNDALVIDIDTEEYGNPIGCTSTFFDTEGLIELSPEETTKLLAEMQEADEDE